MPTSETYNTATEKLALITKKQQEIEELNSWVADLLSGTAEIQIKTIKPVTTNGQTVLKTLYLTETNYSIKVNFTIPVKDIILARIDALEDEIALLTSEVEAAI